MRSDTSISFFHFIFITKLTLAMCLVSPLSVVNLRSHIRQKKGRCSWAVTLVSWFLWCCCKFESCAKALSHPTNEHLYGRSPDNEKPQKILPYNNVSLFHIYRLRRDSCFSVHHREKFSSVQLISQSLWVILA